MDFIVNATIVFATPLLIAGIGGIIAERAGVLNIGLEGFMLLGAFVSAWVAGVGGGSPGAAILVVVLVGLAVGVVYGIVVIYLRGDQVAVGIAFNIFILGLSTYLAEYIENKDGPSALQTAGGGFIQVPGLDSLPWFGAVFDQHWLTYFAYLLVPVAFVVLFRTGIGVRARACGEYSAGAAAVGINVGLWRMGATVVSAMLACLAGGYLVLGDSLKFVVNISAGKGYIALAVIILARWNPVGAFGAALFFGAAQALNLEAQGGIFGVNPPGDLLQAIPYVATILAVMIAGRRVLAPAEDGKPMGVPTG